MSKLIKKTDKVIINAAIDIVASNPGIKYNEVAKKLNVHSNTITNWMTNPDIVEKIYKRYMQIAGNELPAVIQATIEEAKLGNVHACRLVLEHFGKLENKVKIQVESNFEKFMKVDTNTEDAEFFDISDNQEQVLDDLSNDKIVLPERHMSNDTPRVRESFEKDRLKKKIIEKREQSKTETAQSKRYIIRKRAKAVGLDLLSPGRHTRSERNAWMKELERLESEKLKNS